VDPFANLDALARALRTRSAAALLGVAALAAGCGSTGVGPPTANVTGRWTGTWWATNQGSSTVEFDLQQTGADVTGILTWRGSMEAPRASASLNPSGPLKGKVAGQVFTFDRSPSPARGELTVMGDEMRGTMTMMGDALVRVRRQR
jgi:hypothetical protein